MCKSLLYTAMTTSTIVNANGQIPMGQTIRRYGRAIRATNNKIVLLEPGYYTVIVNTTVYPTAATTISTSANANGQPIDGATSSATPTAAGSAVNLGISTVIRVYCCDTRELTVVLGSQGTVTNNTVLVIKQ